METLLQDIRYSFRVMRKSPGFTTVAILTLALGIGANTAIFSIVDTVLLRSLPYPEPDSLVKISFSNPGVGLHDVRFSYPEFDDLSTRTTVFSEVSVAWPSSGNLTGGKRPERLELLACSPNYFSMLGAVPQIGRLFGSQDIAPGFAPVAVISDGLWRRSYGGDRNVVGRSLRIDNDPYTIIGVLPPGFRHPGKTVAKDVEVWLTAGFRADPFSSGRGEREIPGAMGRLKAGLGREPAQAMLEAAASEIRTDFATDYPSQAKWTIEIQPLQESLVGPVQHMLFAIMGAVILIILIASVNIANLLLARASGRQREMAVRLALGASRARMMRQMLTESLALSFIAGVAGVATAALALGFVLRFVPAGIPRLSEVSINWVVLLFALLISMLTGVLFGLAPALQAAKADLFAAIREGARGSGYSAQTSRLRGFLIVSELALAVVLMVGAGLLLRTFRGLLQENPGFNPSNMVVASLWLPVPNDPKADAYDGQARLNTFIREVLRRESGIQGIQLAAITSALPTTGVTNRDSASLTIEDRAVESSQDLRAEVIRVTPDYFKAVQAPLLQGRYFNETDEDGKPPVAIIDETTAHRYWPNQDPDGRRLRLGASAKLPWVTVVGVIKDIKHDGLDKDGVPHIYTSIYQRPGRTMSVVLRTSLPASNLEPEIRRNIEAVDPALPVFNVRSMDEVIAASLATRRFSAALTGVFALLALLLASIGIYGLLTYMVGQRSHELGLRMALGAQRTNILTLILGRGLMLAAFGIVAGLLAAVIATRLIATELYGVHAIDLTVFLAVPTVLLAVSLVASYIPARRATKVDPMIALREG